MATEAQIRAIVADEVERAVSRINALIVQESNRYADYVMRFQRGVDETSSAFHQTQDATQPKLDTIVDAVTQPPPPV